MTTKFKFMLSLMIVLSFIFSNSFALDKQGTTGKITGKVIDAKDKAPLIGAVIKVANTTLGAITDEAGEYTILNVDVGTYSVQASYIGYDPQTVTELKVSADLTSRADFALRVEGSEISTDEIEIVGKRSAISPDQSGQIINKEFIDNSGIRGIQNLASTTAGVVQDEKGTSINIRGGRVSETAVIVDGVLTTNPLDGTSTALVSTNTLEELAVLTGGFSAEYGNVLSGIINVTTKSGTDKYSGSIEGITDGFLAQDYSQGYNVYNLSFGGPLIPTKELSRFINFYGGYERNWNLVQNPSWNADQLGLYNNVLPGASSGSWAYNVKMNFDFSELNKNTPIQLKMGVNNSDVDARQYIGSYMLYNYQNNPDLITNNRQYYAKINQVLSPTRSLLIPFTTTVFGFGTSIVILSGGQNTVGCENPNISTRLLPLSSALYPIPMSSSFFLNPSSTPTTILFNSDLYNPCKALFLLVSSFLVTFISFPLISTSIPSIISRFNVPFGPATSMFLPFWVILTLSEMFTGFLPILLICFYLFKFLPDMADNFTADFHVTGFPVCQ